MNFGHSELGGARANTGMLYEPLAPRDRRCIFSSSPHPHHHLLVRPLDSSNSDNDRHTTIPSIGVVGIRHRPPLYQLRRLAPTRLFLPSPPVDRWLLYIVGSSLPLWKPKKNVVIRYIPHPNAGADEVKFTDEIRSEPRSKSSDG